MNGQLLIVYEVLGSFLDSRTTGNHSPRALKYRVAELPSNISRGWF